ncbi:MAG: nucleotide exchange factor GrpE [Desulfuromonadales bacterium]|nr:nucleotide exchange factor GrpE [Desulfuromonadales bacterium]
MAKKKKNEETDHPEASSASAVEAGAGGAEETTVPPPPPALEEELAAARATAGKNWDLYLRSQAELDNYRKRAQRDREDLQRFANEAILREVLPVLDNLERAVEHASGDQGGEALLQGVQLTLSQLQKVLEKFGVRPIQAVGEPFDPARHEAIGQVESRQLLPNTVAQELQKGYLLNDRLLRPAMVMIARAATEGPAVD